MNKSWAAVAVLFLLNVPAQAGSFGSSARGTTAVGFLELGVGARAVAMGAAYSAVADEASALYWNPAALTAISKRSATFMHAAHVGSSYLSYGAYGQNLGTKGAFGASVQYFSAGGITQTDATGTDTGTFTPYDLAVTLGYAYRLNGVGPQVMDGFAVGLGVKFVQSRILTSAQTGAVDLGILSPGYLDDRLMLAFTAVNLGGTMKFDQWNENLPLALKLGSAYKIADRWLTSLDISFPRNDDPYAALGTEYRFATDGPWKFAGRAGFNSQTIGSIDGFTGVSFGTGIGHNGLAMDYGFLPFGGVGQAHRISLTFNF